MTNHLSHVDLVGVKRANARKLKAADGSEPPVKRPCHGCGVPSGAAVERQKYLILKAFGMPPLFADSRSAVSLGTE